MNRDNTAFRPGGLFYTEVTLQRWELCMERHGLETHKTPCGCYEIVGLLNGPFFFMLIEEIHDKIGDDYVNVLTPWGMCAFDYYDFRDHCSPILTPDGKAPKWAPAKWPPEKG